MSSSPCTSCTQTDGIGAATFGLCWAGVGLGARLGERFGSRAQLAGGAVLIAMGSKILLEHLGLLGG